MKRPLPLLWLRGNACWSLVLSGLLWIVGVRRWSRRRHEKGLLDADVAQLGHLLGILLGLQLLLEEARLTALDQARVVEGQGSEWAGCERAGESGLQQWAAAAIYGS